MTGNLSFGKEKASFNLAKIKVGSERFEIVVHPDKAMDFREGKLADVKDALVSEHIFSDAHKGLAASEHLMEQVFKTKDPLEVARQIIKKGEIQVTAEYRERLREEKRKRIIDIIHRNSIDPKTNLPHPPQRIENAIIEAKARIDEHKKAEDQIQDIVKQLQVVLPIKFEVREIAVKIGAQFAAKSYATLKNYGKITRDEWLNDGSLSAVIELPAGMQQDFFDALNKLTHGNCETKVIGTK